MKKNKFFLAGLPALVLALGMMVAGCDNGTIGNDEAKKITITGISEDSSDSSDSLTNLSLADRSPTFLASGIEAATSNTNESVTITLVDRNGPTQIASGTGTVSDDSVTIELNNQKDKTWTGNGRFLLMLNIDDKDMVYTAGKSLAELKITDSASLLKNLPVYKVSSTESLIDLDQFVENTVSSN